MADVTISSLPTGAPSGSNLIPYSTGSNTLGVPVSALLQNAGNVGIGTASPRAKLDVNGSIFVAAGSQIQITGNAGTDGLQLIGDDAAASYIGTMSLQALIFRTSAIERMRIAATGNVGIGTTAPAEKLTVMGNMSASGDVRATNTPKAWASFNGKAAIGTNQPIRASYNITSILRADDSSYIVTFPAGVFSNANYTFIGSSSTTLQRASIVSGPLIDAPTATTFRFTNFSLVYTGQPAGWIGESAEHINIAFFAL